MQVEKRRMLASARITCDFLGLHEGDTALLCMSLDYIAGKMMVVRALERNLRLITVEPSGHPLAAANCQLSIFNSPQPVASDFEAHLDIIRKQLPRTQSLRHTDIVAIDLAGKLGNGIQSHITL